MIRICEHKILYIPLFLLTLTLLGPGYYVPPQNSTGYTLSYDYIGGRQKKGEDNEFGACLVTTDCIYQR